MWLAYDPGRRGPSGGALPSPFPNPCHVALYGEAGRDDRSVLVVSLRLQFVFKAGHYPETPDIRRTWTAGEKEAFAHASVAAIKATWDNRFRIKTASTVPDTAFRDVGVIFNPSIQISGVSVFEDYEIKVEKTGAMDRDESLVNHRKRTGKLDHRGTESRLQMTTNAGVNIFQQPVAHEFGHLLGLKDEYPKTTHPRNIHWEQDYNSILHSGGAVRPRHYVPFAIWLTQAFANASRRAGVTTKYKVDGLHQGEWDETNALLH